MLIAVPFFKNSFVPIFILVLKNLNHVQVISILPQSDDELLKNSKYITDRAFWQNIFEKWDSSSLSHVLNCLDLVPEHGSVTIAILLI